jgi:DNA-binding PadR family transcriptional regulator
MNPESFLPVPPRDYLILFSLAGGERHGYGIVVEVAESSERRVRLDPANLYRSLRRMVTNGLVEDAGEDEGMDGAPDRRRVYRITELGLAVVRREAARLASLTESARARGLLSESEGAS